MRLGVRIRERGGGWHEAQMNTGIAARRVFERKTNTILRLHRGPW